MVMNTQMNDIGIAVELQVHLSSRPYPVYPIAPSPSPVQG
jgi:hypothetical protein